MSWDSLGESSSVARRLSYEMEDEIAIFRVNRSPDGLNRYVIQAIDEALDKAQASGAKAIVITGQGDEFPGGPPLGEIMSGPTVDRLGDVCARIACFKIPVVAALKGIVTGGALSLALSAHARVAHAGTKLGFKEIEWGLCPFAGATQRLPRLLGARSAIALMLSGRLVPAERSDMAPLFERYVNQDLSSAAMDVARALLARTPTDGNAVEIAAAGLSEPTEYQKAVADSRRGGLSNEAKAVVDCIEAAQLLSIEAGRSFEASVFYELRESPRASGLAHVAQAEMSALSPKRSPPKDVMVFGEGRMARELSLACLDAGAHVHLAERAEGSASRLVREIEEISARQVKANGLTTEHAHARLTRLSVGQMADMAGRAEIVIEAGGFPLSAMGELTRKLLSASGVDVPILLGSNVALRAGEMVHLFEGRVIGAAFQPPPLSARLVELVVPEGVSEGVIERGESLIRSMNKVVLHVAPRNGCLLQALIARFFEAAEWCVGQGASPWEVDRALGWRTGPFAMMDREGLTAQPARWAVIEGQDPDDLLNTTFAAAGRDGAASGRGFFLYDVDGSRAKADPEADSIIARWRKTRPERQRPGPEEIRQRILLALVSRGLELIEGEIVRRPTDVDLAAIHGLGMPRSSGGPMKWAENVGLVRIRKALEAFNASGPRLWRASPALDERIKNGIGFGD